MSQGLKKIHHYKVASITFFSLTILQECVGFFFLKFKSEVASVFWKFKKLVENQSNCKIQALSSDNGKEYTSTKFDSFCEEAGIVHQLTTPYTP